jgi:hypothetical protein
MKEVKLNKRIGSMDKLVSFYIDEKYHKCMDQKRMDYIFAVAMSSKKLTEESKFKINQYYEQKNYTNN